MSFVKEFLKENYSLIINKNNIEINAHKEKKWEKNFLVINKYIIETNNKNIIENFISKVEYKIMIINPYKYQQNIIHLFKYYSIVAIQKLKYLNMGNNIFTNFHYDYKLNKIKTILTGNKFNESINNFIVFSSKNNVDKLDEENILNSYSNLINIDIYIQFISFIIQCNYYKEKRSILANLRENFNL